MSARGSAWLLATVLITGCGSARPSAPRTPNGAEFAFLPPDERPIPPGRGADFRLAAVSDRVARRLPVAGLRCRLGGSGTGEVHLELFAHRLVLPVPAGIGVAPPQKRRGAYVLSGACLYPLHTLEPTGLVLMSSPGRTRPTPGPRSLADLFALWGQPLGRQRLGGFRGKVVAYRNGRRFLGDPGRIPLADHSQIVLEIAGWVPPHRRYRFPPRPPVDNLPPAP